MCQASAGIVDYTVVLAGKVRVLMGEGLDRLRSRLGEVVDLSAASGVLGWDQQTYMPPGGAEARGRSLATLARIQHELFTSAETGELLQKAAEEVAGLDPVSDDAAMVRVAQRDYDQATKLPTSLVSEIAEHGVAAHEVWVRARAANDYPAFAPYLQKTIDLSKKVAEHLGYEDDLYDALLDQFEPGMKTAQVTQLFSRLREELVPLARAITERQGEVDDRFLHGLFDEGKQEQFGKEVITAFGYDFTRGRQDRTVHPFEISFSVNDARITTRFDPDFLNTALFSTLHESGHGMYEQGVAQSLDGTILAGGASLGLHESQSRLWENIVGRSRNLWSHYYPRLQELFPEQLGEVDLESFYRAINKVEPSLIRIEADEVTYNLHIMLRFELEQAFLSGEVAVLEADQVWKEKMGQYLGVTPPDNADGILQDVHWSQGMMGYFPTYSLGNIISGQLWAAARAAHPEIPDEIASGQFSTLHGWLTENVYRWGRVLQPNEIIQRATGGSIDTGPYVQYLRDKYSDMYGL